MNVKKIITELFKFGIVGGLGTLTNLAIFYLGADLGSVNETVMSIAAFCVAVTQNYILNHFFTFSDKTKGEKLSFKNYFKFISVSL